MEDPEPFLVLSGEREVPAPHLFVKGLRLAVESVELFLALLGPLEPGRDGQVEEKRPVGNDPAGGDPVQPFDLLEGEAARVALIGDGGVREPVAEDHGPALEGRAHDFFHVVAPGELVEQELRGRRHAPGLVGEEGLPNGVRQGGPARFSGQDDLPRPAQIPGQGLDLGRFAGPFDALEGDEKAPCFDMVHEMRRVRKSNKINSFCFTGGIAGCLAFQ
jgi:hypothetical protein